MTHNEKLEIIADIFDLTVSEILPEMTLESLNWDSMKKLATIVVFKNEFDKKIPISELLSFKTVQDLVNATE